MIVTAILVSIVAASVLGLWWLLRRQTPHPIDDRQTVDWEELKAMWPHDAGSPE